MKVENYTAMTKNTDICNSVDIFMYNVVQKRWGGIYCMISFIQILKTQKTKNMLKVKIIISGGVWEQG